MEDQGKEEEGGEVRIMDCMHSARMWRTSGRGFYLECFVSFSPDKRVHFGNICEGEE